MNTSEDFNLDVNPYDYLEIKRGCRDLKEIKRAYRRKSLLMHPDKNNGAPADFSVLNKCFIYLKTLCDELDGKGTEFVTDLDDRVRKLQTVRDSVKPPQALSTDIPEMPGIVHQQHHQQNQPQHANSGSSSKKKIDFEQQLRHDNAVIGAEDFNADKCLADMMQHRPTTTKYHSLEQPAVQNPFLGKNFSINKFNTYFETRKSAGDFDNQFGSIEGFASFEEFGNGASVVSDGRFMFVQGNAPDPAAGESGSIGYNLIADHAYDRNFEQQRYNQFKHGEKVSTQDEQKFKNMYHSAVPGGDGKRKLTTAEFKERMSFMEAQTRDRLEEEKRKQREVVERQMLKLSETAQANLRNNLQISY